MDQWIIERDIMPEYKFTVATMFNFLSNFFDSNEKQLKKLDPIVSEIDSYEEDLSTLSDQELANKTTDFREIIGVDPEQPSRSRNEDVDPMESREKLLKILPEAFAVVREMAKRRTNHRHFKVQLVAGHTLATNKISELFTGEGKTNAANLPLYLYGLTGRGAHLITVNDYLARRDGEWNGHILHALGLSVGILNGGAQYKFVSDKEAIELKGGEVKKAIKQRDKGAKESGRLKLDQMEGTNLVEVSKKEVYDCDVIYGTNNEFGFDYLRDNMSNNVSDLVQGPLHYAIVDEADSILIDEARTPLIISQNASAANNMYRDFATLVRQLEPESHYSVDEKAHSVALSDDGIDQVEKILKVDNAYEDSSIAYHLENALKAKELYQRDDSYLVRDGEVIIVDEFTGRALPGRRYSEGLHQAIEAKEGVEVKRESRTLATITLQNYFRLYDHLAGMTATALTEAEELASIYDLDVLVVPTNEKVIREDFNDVVYKSREAKNKAIVEEVKEHNAKGQPILVGTASVENSEVISELLSKEGVKHNVLNAKQHEREAHIVQSAGQEGQVTIATNMAGRGTDIALGKGIQDLGGLYVIGSERHESRRIDNQLRGRSGRQGDPGKSKFFVSFDDDLMRIFGGDRMMNIMDQVGLEDDIPISMGLLGKTIENAQKRVESHNYDIRKRLVEYDDVLNQQREIVYNMRRGILRVVGAPKKSTSEKLDKKALDKINWDVLTEELDGFSIRNEDSWSFSTLKSFPAVDKPINLWLLRRYVDHVHLLVSSQLKDDMRIDDVEERKTIAQIRSLLTEQLIEEAAKLLGYKNDIEFFKAFDSEKDIAKQEMLLVRLVVTSFIKRVYDLGEGPMNQLAKLLILQTIDNYWMEHLDAMATLREGINMRSLAQKDPLVEYKNEGFSLFEQMHVGIDESVVKRFFKIRVVREEDRARAQALHNATNNLSRPKVSGDNRPGQVVKQATVKRSTPKLGRNEKCYCGSGKKYKHCHGKA